MHCKEKDPTIVHTLTGLLKILVAHLFKFTKDGSHVCAFHEYMKMMNQEHECIKLLQTQLSLFKEIADASGDFVATVQNDPAILKVASQCRTDVFSILLDAEASFSVIGKFLTMGGYEVSTGPIISDVD